MRKFGFVIGAAALAFAGAAAASAQESEPSDVPEPTIQPLAIEFSADGLSGPGAQMLRDEISNAQFIAVGEDHGFADAPVLLGALAIEGAAHGFDTYAVEVGPWSAGWVRESLTNGGVDGFAAELQERPLAVPFLSLREEAEVAMRFLEDGKLWGIDQEFIGSSLIHLEWFADRAGEGDAGDELREWLAADKQAFNTGQQQAVFMASAGPDKFARLREIFAGDDDALELIAALEVSQAIYMANFTGRGFDNNTDRVALIRDYFVQHYAAAKEELGEAPRVVMKMGAVHVGAGTSPMKTFDIGSLIEGMAAAEGRTALRIAYLPMGGEQLAIRPSPDGIFSIVEVTRGEELGALLASAGVDVAAISDEEHYVIALDPVRRALGNRGLNDAKWMNRFLLLGFDYLVTTNAAEAGTPLAGG